MKKDRKRFLGVTLMALNTITLGLFFYILCSACFYLYKAGYIEDFVAMLMETIFAGTLAFHINVISMQILKNN